MTYNFYRISDIVRKRGGNWALEWPSKCEYWDSPQVVEFLKRQRVKVFEATATGCAWNLRAIAGHDKGHVMSKAWHIKSTLPLVEEYLHRDCCCPPGTYHAQAKGPNTAHTGRYTPEFVSAVHRMFALYVSRSGAGESSA